MPAAHEILEGLSRISNDFVVVAIAWHLLVALAAAAVMAKVWRPSNRVAAVACALPAVSVSVLAWTHHNPFNGATFAVLSALLVAFGVRASNAIVQRGPTWAVAIGVAALAYGWSYPHFLESRPSWMYLVAAPMGLVPCPTLSAVLGAGLVAGGFRSRGWSLSVACAGLFYALFGMLRLGVWLDAGLLVVSVASIVTALARRGDHRLAELPGSR